MIQKKIIEYIFRDNIKGIMFMNAITLVVIGLGGFLLYINGESAGSVSGLEITVVIYLFVAMLAASNEYTKLFTQNGFSRKTIFENLVISTGMIALVLTGFTQVIDLLGEWIFDNGRYKYQTLTENIYGIQGRNIFAGAIWLFAFLILVGIIGYGISAFYACASKQVKIIVSISVPVFLMIIFPLLDVFMFRGKTYAVLSKVVAFLFGFTAEGGNIWLAVGNFFIFGVILLVIIYPSFISRRKFN